MTSTTLNFGTIGRCACGCIGKRRSTFADEPICDRCITTRSGYLHTPDPQNFDWRVIGMLTPAQRRARVAFLAKSAEREAQLQARHDEFVACAGSAG